MRIAFMLVAVSVALGGCSTMSTLGTAVTNAHCQPQPGQVVPTEIACQGGACYEIQIKDPPQLQCRAPSL